MPHEEQTPLNDGPELTEEEKLRWPRLPGFPRPEDAKCAWLLSQPAGRALEEALRVAKANGVVRDRGHCMELANNAEQLATLIGAIPSLVTGETARCACKKVF